MKRQIISIVFVILGAAAILGFRSGYKTQKILNVINTECNCMQISQNDSMHGLSYSKESGMNLGDTYTFTLQNCTFDTFEKDIDRLANNLSKEVNGFCNADVLVLIFKQENIPTQKIIINDCKWEIK